MKYLIKGPMEKYDDEFGDDQLYWSNDLGWVDIISATVFDSNKGAIPQLEGQTGILELYDYMENIPVEDLKLEMEVWWKDPSPIEGQEYKKGAVVDFDKEDKDNPMVYVCFYDGSEAEVYLSELFR